MRTTELEVDVAVVGGGLAGVAAAVAAARQGVKVALLQNRSVLGGNSSSEVRVWVCGATAHGVHQWARETGIMGELFLENQFQNREGNPYYWDLVVHELVRAEPNIELWLNTDVRSIESTPSAGVTAVTGWQMGSETTVRVQARNFVDATGDGLVGALAGAEFRTGREAREVYEESWAPEVADAKTLGSTILFYSKDIGVPSKFVAPEWAIKVGDIPEKSRRNIRSTANGCDFWWIEWGGDRDIVDDNELIRQELQAVAFGIWDHIKNSGEFSDVENRTLEWIGSLPGKREYRRFIGDHVLTQHDVLNRQEFPDAVAFGGWSIDLHPPGGIYAPDAPSRHWHPLGNYPIPMRCLYSRNVANLWMAGRNISASHVAFGSTRVMATCAVVGEAAGLGAALAVRHGLSPRELATERFDLVRHQLIRTDASVLGMENLDPADLARQAKVSASSYESRLECLQPDTLLPVNLGVAMILPGGDGLGLLEFAVETPGGATVELRVHTLAKPQDTYPCDDGATAIRTTVTEGSSWVGFDLGAFATAGGNVFVSLTVVDGDISVWQSNQAVPGVVGFTRREVEPHEEWTEQHREWKVLDAPRPFVFRVPGGTTCFGPHHLTGGLARPCGGPHMWRSDPSDAVPTVELEWDTTVTIAEVQLVLDDDLAVDLINLHHHTTPDEVMPTLVRDYNLEIRTGQSWQTVAEVRGNRRRHRRHQWDEAIAGDAVRITVLATNGAPRAHIVKVRVY